MLRSKTNVIDSKKALYFIGFFTKEFEVVFIIKDEGIVEELKSLQKSWNAYNKLRKAFL